VIRCQCCAGVAVRYPLETMDGVIGIGEQSARLQFVAKPCIEYPALARVKGGAELLIVLDLRADR
jgi:hypothetical protein